MANSKIKWNGNTVDGRTTSIEWNDNPYTWGDVALAIEIADIIDDGLGTKNRRAREDRLRKLNKDKKKRLIHLICRIKGEKVYDETKEIEEVEIKVEDVEMVTENIIGKVKLEMKSGI